MRYWCSTGLDTAPLPGDITPKALAELLARVARLFPAPGCAAGEVVRTGSQYLYNCPAMDPEG